jgi:hypothetical protein
MGAYASRGVVEDATSSYSSGALSSFVVLLLVKDTWVDISRRHRRFAVYFDRLTTAKLE